MAGSCIINGVDIADLGMFILRGGDNDLIAFPSRKEPPSNDWYELDGLDVDLSEVYFNAKKVTIKFYLAAETSEEFTANMNAFRHLITSSGYKSIYIREFNKTFRLRYISCSQFTFRGGLIKPACKCAELDIQFSDDDPCAIFDGTLVPVSQKENDTYVYLNDIELKAFGITVKNIYNTALQLAEAKDALTITNARRNGQIVYPGSTLKSKKITIECVMQAATLAEFYTNYNALFNNLSLAEALSLKIADGNDVSCYYSNMTGFTKMHPFSRGVMVTFSIELVDISFRQNTYILAAEDGSVLVTEDELNTLSIYYE